MKQKREFDNIKHFIKKYVFPSRYPLNTFAYDVGRFIEDSYYTPQEIAFIDDMRAKFADLHAVDYSGSPCKKILLQYNVLLNFERIHYMARNVYNGVIGGKLYCGDNITRIVKTALSDTTEQRLTFYSSVFEWFFEYAADKKAILRCDLKTNRNLFDMNFLNTIIYRLNDGAEKIKLLEQLQAKYGSFLRVADTLCNQVLI